MRLRAGILAVAVFALLTACAPPLAPPVNSLAFQRRAPPPGQPGYLETIKFIDDGVRYISPTAEFFVSSTGDLCFLGALTPGVTPEYFPPTYWCMSPFAISRIEAIDNNITYINQVRLWCRLADPQCAYKIGYPNMLDNRWVANSITAETVPVVRQRDALGYLVYLMGGGARREQALELDSR